MHLYSEPQSAKDLCNFTLGRFESRPAEGFYFNESYLAPFSS